MFAETKPEAPSRGGQPKRRHFDLKSVRRAYARYANVYDVIFGVLFEPGRRAAVKAVNTEPEQRILEVGVGTGLSLPRYRADARVVGIDVSPEMLRRAGQRVAAHALSQVEALHEMDAQEMRFADDSFDAVVAMYTVSAVPDVARMFEEIRRVCVPGGRIVVVNHFASNSGLAGLLERIMVPLSSTIGFRPDLEEGAFLELVGVGVEESRKINIFGNRKLIRLRNTASP